MTGRIPIVDIHPMVDCGRRPAKAVVGETFQVTRHRVPREPAGGGRERRAARPRGRHGPWTPMTLVDPGTDRWEAEVTPDRRGPLDVRASRRWSDPIAHLAPHARRSRSRPASTPSWCSSRGRAAVRAGRGRVGVTNGGRQVAARPRWPVCGTSGRAAHRTAGRRADPRGGRRAGRHPAARAGHRLSQSCRCRWSASGRCSAPGTSSSPARRAPSSTRGPGATAFRHLPHRGRSGCRRSPPWASTWSTCRRSTRSARAFRKGPNNTLVAGPRRPGLAVGDRLPRGRPRRHPSGPRHPRGLRRLRRPGRRARAGGRAGLRAAVLPGPSLGRQAPGVVHHTAPTAPSPTPRTRRRSTRTSTRSPSTPTPRAITEECLRVLRHWMAHGVRIFRVDNPHTKPVAFWERRDRGDQPHRPGRDLPRRGVHPRPAMMHALARSASTSRTPTSPGATPRRS